MPNKNSPVRLLPRDQQQALYDQLLAGMTYEQGVAWVRDNCGLETSIGALQGFFGWYANLLQQEDKDQSNYLTKLQRAAKASSLIQEILAASPELKLDSKTLADVGQTLFESQALSDADPKLYLNMRKLRIEERRLEIESERFEIETCKRFLEWFKDARAREIAESRSSETDKIAALRKTFLADIDALEQSGEVALPE